MWPPCSSIYSPILPLSSRLPTQTDSCTNSLHCKKLNHTIFFVCVLFFLNSSLWFKFDHYKHCSKCYERNVHLVFSWVFLYKTGRSRLLRLPAFVPFPRLCCHLHRTLSFLCGWFRVLRHATLLPPSFPQTPWPLLCWGNQTSQDCRFKIDLCIFIYVYIKKEWGRGVIRRISSAIPFAVSGGRKWFPGIRAQGGRGEADAEMREAGRGEGAGSSVCSWVRLVCVECQLIMSLLLTPYVEFFMLSLTSLLNTDRFWVNLQRHGQTCTHEERQAGQKHFKLEMTEKKGSNHIVNTTACKGLWLLWITSLILNWPRPPTSGCGWGDSFCASGNTVLSISRWYGHSVLLLLLLYSIVNFNLKYKCF